MARGEQGTRGRGASLAIAAAFAVLCLVVLFGVLSTTRACEDGTTPPPPHMLTAPEPFPGAFAAASRLSTRGCRQLGPGMTPASHRAGLDQELTDRAYVPDGAWSAPTTLPAEIEVTGCGVVAAVADGGLITAAFVDSMRREPPCGSERLVFGSCGPAPIRIEGRGDILVRRFLAPGLTATDAEASGIDVDTLLAHAEAEVLLGAIGYSPSDELVVDSLGSVPRGHYHNARPPLTPDEGCVVWVGVATGLGSATVTWPGPSGSGYMPANVSADGGQDTATFALFACGADSGAIKGEAEASLYAPRAGDARIVYRAFAAASSASPTFPVAPAAPTVATAREVDQSDAVLPTTVAFVRPEEE